MDVLVSVLFLLQLLYIRITYFVLQFNFLEKSHTSTLILDFRNAVIRGKHYLRKPEISTSSCKIKKMKKLG